MLTFVMPQRPRKPPLPTLATPFPAMTHRAPTNEARAPSTKARVPFTKARVPTTEAPVPTTKARVPSTEARVPFIQARVPSTKARVPFIKARVPTTGPAVMIARLIDQEAGNVLLALRFVINTRRSHHGETEPRRAPQVCMITSNRVIFILDAITPIHTPMPS
jgi:hypothetical protein